MMLLGSAIGYASAVLLRVVGGYCVLFVAFESAVLLTLIATGVITQETAFETLKYTLPPVAWTATALYKFLRWDFSNVTTGALGMRVSFLIAFLLTLRYSRLGGMPLLRSQHLRRH